jgi:hypothetical protein
LLSKRINFSCALLSRKLIICSDWWHRSVVHFVQCRPPVKLLELHEHAK